MRIGMQTWGSHGDIRPFLALAEGLQAAGNEVHLVVTCIDSDAYRDAVSKHGVRITMVASPVLNLEQQREAVPLAHRIRNPMKQVAEIMRLCFAPVEDAMFAAARDLCAESDLLIGHHFTHPLQTAAELAGKPYVSVVLSHATLPSDYQHPVGQPWMGKAGNRFLWWLTRVLLNPVLLPYPNRVRRAHGMPPLTDIFQQSWLSRDLTLAGTSPAICQRQPDWPDSLQVCGFLNARHVEIEGTPPPALPAFLAAGEAPIFMTFGSWMPRDHATQRETLAVLTEAARLAGCRAIIQGNAAEACGFASDERILYVSTAPHAALFPHCRAVVHHGGAGTTQSATLAGRPSIVVHNISEQEHWGRELCRLGIGARPLKRGRLTAEALARRIREVLAAPDMADRARAIGARMREEDGVTEAVRLVMERFGDAGRRVKAA